MNNSRNRIIAISGIFQAAALVQQIAWTGKFDHNLITTLIESIFTIDATSIEDIYKDLTKLRYGLEVFIRIFDATNQLAKDQEIARYALSLIHIEKCLSKRKDLLNIIHEGVLKIQNQMQNFSLPQDAIMVNLANIYTDTLSTLNFRIHVNGEQNYLITMNNANKIRALLLAGVRAAVLWRQMGGNRWQLLFFRKRIINDAKALLAELSAQ